MVYPDQTARRPPAGILGMVSTAWFRVNLRWGDGGLVYLVRELRHPHNCVRRHGSDKTVRQLKTASRPLWDNRLSAGRLNFQALPSVSPSSTWRPSRHLETDRRLKGRAKNHETTG
jgi:hypothetical protein